MDPEAAERRTVTSLRRATPWVLAMALFGCASRDREDPASVAPRTSGWNSSAPIASAEATAAASTDTPPAAEPAKVTPLPMPEHQLAVVDMHVDTPYQIGKGRSLDLPEGHATGDKLRAGHYFGIVYPIYIADSLHDDQPRISDADEILKTIHDLVARHDWLHFDRPGPVQSGVTAFISIEGAGAFAEDIEQIDRFIDAGVRLIGPVHAHDSPLATSATGKNGAREGLSELGKTFCRRVYDKGALIDVSHMSDRSFEDLVPIAREAGAPIVATHSNARKLANHPRNLTDDQLRKIAETGGVAGLNLHSTFLSGVHDASLKHAVDQTLYMVEIAGIDHVGIGSDFDGARPPDDLSDASKLPVLAEALKQQGMSEQEVTKIFSRNALRMLRWSPAR